MKSHIRPLTATAILSAIITTSCAGGKDNKATGIADDTPTTAGRCRYSRTMEYREHRVQRFRLRASRRGCSRLTAVYHVRRQHLFRNDQLQLYVRLICRKGRFHHIRRRSHDRNGLRQHGDRRRPGAEFFRAYQPLISRTTQ